MRAALGVVSARRRWPFWFGLAVALLLHAAGAWLLLPHGAGRSGVPLADPPAIEIEMVEQAEEVKGAPASGTAAPPPAPPPARPPEPKAEEAPQSPPTPAAPPPPQPSLQPPAAAAAPMPQAPAAPAVNLGDAQEDQDALTVTGKDVVPPRPNSQFRNKPPGYPIEAARRHREGTVLVRARISEAGVPSAVDVATSSGDASLDRAAREAVQLWRFEPARENGVAVPFDYDVNIRFSLGDR